LTKAVNIIDNFVFSQSISERWLVPVVEQGKTIVSVINQAKKNLAAYQPQ
jgi:hypothetical protein